MLEKDSLTEMPSYRLAADASPEEIRATAVRAMRDGLLLRWTPRETITYEKRKNGVMCPFAKEAGTVYVGMPYTDGSTGILTWLQYYDFKTGVFTCPEGDFNELLGNSCAIALAWGWYAVIPDLDMRSTYTFTRARGCVPVGGYDFDPAIDDLRTVSTKAIIRQNGREKILEAYTECQPADALIMVGLTNAGNHAMMVVEAPWVVRFPDGRIDPEKSVLVIQDQRGRTKPYEVDGEEILLSGRVRTGITFAELIRDGYIPVTLPGLTGQEPHVPASVTAEGPAGDAARLGEVTLVSPYPIIALTAAVSDAGGRVLGSAKKVLSKKELFNGKMRRFPLKDFPLPELPAGAAKLSISTLVATGESFEPLTVSLA